MDLAINKFDSEVGRGAVRQIETIPRIERNSTEVNSLQSGNPDRNRAASKKVQNRHKSRSNGINPSLMTTRYKPVYHF